MIFWLKRVRQVLRQMRFSTSVSIGIVLVLFFGVSFFLLSTAPPHGFPSQMEVTIPAGFSLLEATTLLEEEGIVRSSFLLQLILLTSSLEGGVRAGSYVFPEPLSAFEIAHAIARGGYAPPPIRLTVHEGLRITQIGELVEETHPNITRDAFVQAARGKEGYLFPDTYYVPKNYTARELVQLMEETFEERLASLEEDIANSTLTFDEVIILASILEREARHDQSMALVAGILLKRLEIGMALQVDAPFEYIYEKSAVDLLSEDLEIDSPYNTYKNRGLTPTPIGNPGLFAIEAVLNPKTSPYLYYITGNDGNFYYAETFDQHRRNINRYLR